MFEKLKLCAHVLGFLPLMETAGVITLCEACVLVQGSSIVG